MITIVVVVCWSLFAYHFGSSIYHGFEKKIFSQEEIIVFVDKSPQKIGLKKKLFTKLLFDSSDPYYKDVITKKEILNKLHNADALKVLSTTKADTYLLSMVLIILFLFWIIPLLLLLLLAIYLRGTKIAPIYD